MTYKEIIEAEGKEVFVIGDKVIYQIPINIAYFDKLGIPKDKNNNDVTRSHKYIWFDTKDEK